MAIAAAVSAKRSAHPRCRQPHGSLLALFWRRNGSEPSVPLGGKNSNMRSREIAPRPDRGVALARPTRSSTSRPIGKTTEPDRWTICAEPGATWTVELLAQRSGRVIRFVALAPLQLGHDQIDKIGGQGRLWLCGAVETHSSGLPPAIPPMRRQRCLPPRRRNSTGWNNLVWTGASRVPLTAMHPTVRIAGATGSCGLLLKSPRHSQRRAADRAVNPGGSNYLAHELCLDQSSQRHPVAMAARKVGVVLHLQHPCECT